MISSPKNCTFQEFEPLVRAAMEEANNSLNTMLPVSVADLMRMAEKICPGINWAEYGTRKFGPGGGEGLNAVWMFSFTANRLVKDGVFVKDGDRYRSRTGTRLTEVFQDDLPLSDPEPAPETAEAAITVTQKGVSMNLGSFVFADSNAYHGDIFLSRVAAEQTKCFGEWSQSAKPCANCNLAKACFQKSIMTLSQIGKTLDKGITPKVVVETPPPPVESKPKEIPGTTLMVIPVATVCQHCRKAIPAGENARSKKGAGVFHLNCFDQVKF